jgi:antitoxin component YwqK of YwqJK toxin-antitoxin module
MAGRLVADGEFVNGLREGRWRRLQSPEDSPPFRDPLYAGFDSPFLSEAGFHQGKLHGVWKVTDARGRPASFVRYAAGEREGLSEWWYASGRLSQQAEYRRGRLHGELVRWNAGGEELFRRGFDDAREIVMQTASYPGGQRRESLTLLTAPLTLDSRDDWWTGHRGTHRPEGSDERHGMTALWHANGQIARHGAFEHDLPIGTHTWWFAQGQKAVRGDFLDGHAEGEWVWWRPSGQERARGHFHCGLPVGEWCWTRLDGSTIIASGDQVIAASNTRTLPSPRNGFGTGANSLSANALSANALSTNSIGAHSLGVNPANPGPLGQVAAVTPTRPLPLDPHVALQSLYGTQWPLRDAPPTPPAMLTTARKDSANPRR